MSDSYWTKSSKLRSLLAGELTNVSTLGDEDTYDEEVAVPGPSGMGAAPARHTEQVLDVDVSDDDDMMIKDEILSDDSTTGFTPVFASTHPRPQSPVPSTPSVSASGEDDNSAPLHSADQNVWDRIFPPENQSDVESKFSVRKCGPKYCRSAETPYDFFSLFFSDSIISIMVNETNIYAHSEIERLSRGPGLAVNSRLRHWSDVTLIDMKKFLALMLFMGINNRKNMNEYWDTDPIHILPFVSRVMPLRRFQAIHATLNLSSKPSLAQDHPEYDPWVKVRPILDQCNRAFRKYYVPGQNLSIDESMVGMKKSCAFIQYMPNKRHARYGVNKFEIVDSATSYVLHVSLYSDRDLQAGEDTFIQKVVYDLLRKSNCLGKGYHIFTDNFYTKLPLAAKLFDENTFLTGTLNRSTKDLPRNLLSTKLGIQESVYYRKGSILLIGYKQENTSKPVYLLTTAYHAEDKSITSRSGLVATKPIAIDRYNKFMGGVHCSDKSTFHLSCSRATRQYWKKVFFNLLDMSVLNAFILYNMAEKDKTQLSRRAFITSIIRVLSGAPQQTASSPPVSKKIVVHTNLPDGAHGLMHLPGKNARKCWVCRDKKKSVFWCPGCNAGVHMHCYRDLEHSYKGKKMGPVVKQLSGSDYSDSD